MGRREGEEMRCEEFCKSRDVPVWQGREMNIPEQTLRRESCSTEKPWLGRVV